MSLEPKRKKDLEDICPGSSRVIALALELREEDGSMRFADATELAMKIIAASEAAPVSTPTATTPKV